MKNERIFSAAVITLTLSLLSFQPIDITAQNSGPSLGVDRDRVEISDTLDGWDYSLMTGINGSQTSFKNWSQGGVNSISGTALSWFEAMYRKDQFGYLLNVNLKYGRARLEGEGTRKTSDQISVRNKFSHNFEDRPYSLYGNVDFNSQFDEGVDYSSTDEVVISRFMAPGYFRQGVGFSYEPFEFLTLEAGLGLKETIMQDTSLSTRYGLEAGQKFRFEAGGTFSITIEKQIMENIKFRSSFDSFTNIQKSFKHTDIEFSNQLVGSINKYINTTFDFVLVYDRDYSSAVQIKQMLSAGLQINVL